MKRSRIFRNGPLGGHALRRALLHGLPFLPLFLACAGDLSRRYPTPVTDAGHWLERLDALDRAIESDRRVFDFRLRRGLFSSHGEGVFLYRRPDRVRIDLYVGTSELVFQYRRRGERSTLYLPAEGRTLEGQAGEIELAGVKGVEGVRVRDEELLALMLGLYRRPPDGEGGEREARRGEDGLLLCYERGNESVSLEHDLPTLALERVRVSAPDRRERTLTFSGRRPVSGQIRPWTMKWVDRENDLELRVEVREERINGAIDEGLFSEGGEPTDGPGRGRERFDNPRD